MTAAPPPEELADAATLKALAHPLRRRILAELRRGPASATTLATALGHNTGGTSYHLRELARHGFVEEDPALGRGKERWWRVRERDPRTPPAGELSADTVKLLTTIRNAQLAEDVDAWERYQQERGKGREEHEWADAVEFSRGSLTLTRAELTQFFDDYMALLKRYRRAPRETPQEARRILLRFIAFPDVPPAPNAD
ncbi:ArsR/SmtB family transcription factor [Allokutzneria oryzae]|uniref:ArsR/SmtB family transcription factor n=1 Tax=Allokutzneria oryzae TaxID=1378989 RepID=A0ABV5ZSR8_9PSEU